MISSLLHLVGLRPRVYYTLTNFRGEGGGGKAPLAPPLNTPMISVMICATSPSLVTTQYPATHHSQIPTYFQHPRFRIKLQSQLRITDEKLSLKRLHFEMLINLSGSLNKIFK